MRALLVLFVLVACASPRDAGLPIESLSGVWRVNRRESDNTRKTVLEAIGVGKGRGAARREGEEIRDAAERTELLRQQMQTTVHTPSTMEIRRSGDAIEIVDGTRVMRTFRADGGLRKQVIDVEGEVEGRARWRDGELVTEIDGRDGLRITEAYRLAGERLLVTVTIANPQLEAPIVIRRVYERSR